MSNRKPDERKGKVLLIDASSMSLLTAFTAAKKQGVDRSQAKLSVKSFELTRKVLGTYDKTAEDIDACFQREVLPHWRDAWVNHDVKDGHDGQTGVVGNEINFNREFYVYTPPRSREAIQADIEAARSPGWTVRSSTGTKCLKAPST